VLLFVKFVLQIECGVICACIDYTHPGLTDSCDDFVLREEVLSPPLFHLSNVSYEYAPISLS
jgi:hypothetical protein